ncbi:uncharacterized protein LOC134239535 [Saccostrea cucullata]|uniref:uncharacterized protein LOC134239535 n=1 Tax=Saccostrea cuccullata TaxID=36930 RepID=UPI002ED01CE9
MVVATLQDTTTDMETSMTTTSTGLETTRGASITVSFTLQTTERDHRNFLAWGKFEYTLFETIEDNHDRNLTSPGYPANYPNNANYTWIIKPGYLAYIYFVIFFTDIKSSQTNQCNDDYLQITEIDPCCHTPLKRCGQFNNISILTKGNKIRVSFVSDRSETGKGFLLFWNVSFIPSSSPLTTTSQKQITTLQQGTTTDVKTLMTTTSTELETTREASTTVSLPLQTTTVRRNHRIFLVYIFVVSGVIVVGLLFGLGCLTKQGCCIRRAASIKLTEKDRISSNENDLNPVPIYSSAQEAETVLYEDSRDGVYMEYPEGVYDTPFVKRPHVEQSNQNIYAICKDLVL